MSYFKINRSANTKATRDPSEDNHDFEIEDRITDIVKCNSRLVAGCGAREPLPVAVPDVLLESRDLRVCFPTHVASETHQSKITKHTITATAFIPCQLQYGLRHQLYYTICITLI